VTHYRSSPFNTSYAWLTLRVTQDPSGISLVSTSKQNGASPCDVTSATTSPTTFDGPVTVYDDSHAHTDLSDATIGREVEARDANFKSRVAPHYPGMAMEMGVEGSVTVEIAIGPQGGSPQAAWVRSVDDGPGQFADEFSQASLAAAQASTFTPPIVDGRPHELHYLIVYTFSIGSGQGRFPTPRSNGCPVSLGSLREIAPTQSDANARYFFDVSETGKNAVSAVIAIEDQQGRIARYPWSALTFHRPPDSRAFPTAEGTMNWPDPHVRAMWVDEVTASDGSTTHCSPDIEEPELVAGGDAAVRLITGAPPGLLGIEPVGQPQFEREVWPEYPAASDGTRAAGHVTIDAFVGGDGKVVDAFVTGSSGLAYLDKAAVDAAIASTCQPASKGTARAYELTYRFVP
jgi:TonB family protein